jgi:hypothetical protein
MKYFMRMIFKSDYFRPRLLAGAVLASLHFIAMLKK